MEIKKIMLTHVNEIELPEPIEYVPSTIKFYPNDMKCCYNCMHRNYSHCDLSNSRRYDDQVCDRFKRRDEE